MPELDVKFNRVMVIDDNPIDLFIADKLMRKNGFSHNVLAFDSAIPALEFLQQHQNEPSVLPEIIFVDIYMPEMSGFEFLEAYNRFPGSFKDKCRVYVVSSSIDEHDIKRVNGNTNVAGFGIKTMTADFLASIPAR